MALCSPLVVFDFDHTLTDRETLSRFLLCHLPKTRVIKAFLMVPFILPGYMLRFGMREGFKRGILRAFLAGMPAVEFLERARRYANQWLPQFLKPPMHNRLMYYVKQGYEVWLISGSLSAYLSPLANSLGIKVVLACEMAIGPEGKLTGSLRGGNCWGPEKLRRLRLVEPLAERPLIMFGDSRGDQELLQEAWEGHLVSTR
jgi:phosphatidylglycerophosphatase C